MQRNNIRKLREAAGMTQAELAKAVGTTQPQIAIYESGIIPRWKTMCKLCRVFNATVEDIWPAPKEECYENRITLE